MARHLPRHCGPCVSARQVLLSGYTTDFQAFLDALSFEKKEGCLSLGTEGECVSAITV